MNEKKNNRSTRRTQKLLKDCLTDLMRQKPISKITVKELTDAADLNRGTFYLHYKDIYDLLEQIENETFDEFVEISMAHQPLDKSCRPYPLLLDLFTFMEKNKEFVQLILIENRDQKFVDKLKEIIRMHCIHVWDTLFAVPSTELSEFYASYIISGCVGIIEYWMEHDAAQSPEELAQKTEAIILKGVSIFPGFVEP